MHMNLLPKNVASNEILFPQTSIAPTFGVFVGAVGLVLGGRVVTGFRFSSVVIGLLPVVIHNP